MNETRPPTTLLCTVRSDHIHMSQHLVGPVPDKNDGLDLCCPIALALRERTGYRVKVDHDYAHIANHTSDDIMCKYGLSKRARAFAKRFDAGEKVQPANFRFRLRAG